MKKYIACFFTIIFLCTSLFACGSTENSNDIPYGNIAFVSEEAKDKWRADLLKLISNEGTMHYDGDTFADYYDYPRPDEPGIRKGWYLGLFDINVDGIPELLVDLGGGSSGNACYEVFDIRSGKKLGNMSGGREDSWCIYLNAETGQFETIGQYQWRCGWAGKWRFVNKAWLADEMDKNGYCLRDEPYLFAGYTLESVTDEPDEEEKEAGTYVGTWEEKCRNVSFQVQGENVTIEDYFSAQDHFVENYVRVPETSLKLIKRYDYTSAEEMVDALLSTSQEFIRPAE